MYAAPNEYLARPAGYAILLLWSLRGILRKSGQIERAGILRMLSRSVLIKAQAARLAHFLESLSRDRPLEEIIVHAHFLNRPAEVAAAALAEKTNKLIVTVHASDSFIPPSRESNRVVQRVDLFRCASSIVENNILHASPTASTVNIPCIFSRPLAPSNLVEPIEPLKQMSIITVARLVSTKGFTDMMAVIEGIASRGYCVSWHIVGDGPMHDEIVTWSAGLAGNAVVRMYGEQPNSYALRYIQESNAFMLLPTKTSYINRRGGDGLPVAILEAMALQTPVVVSGSGAIPEAIVDEENGLVLATPPDENDIQRVVDLLLSPEAQRRLAGSALQTIETRYDPDRSVATLIEESHRLV